MRKLVVTTPCTRPQNLAQVHSSIFGSPGARHFEIQWNIVFDAMAVPEIPVRILEEFGGDPSIALSAVRSSARWRWYTLINSVLERRRGEDFWHYVLDDDNLMHPDLLTRIDAGLQEHPEARGFIFSQWVGGRDFSGLEVRHAGPANVAVSKIDQAQYLLHSSLIGDRFYPDHDYFSDGRFIVEIYHSWPETFVLLDEVLSYYNRLRTPVTRVALPRILVVGRSGVRLRSRARAFEASDLEVECVESDGGVVEAVRRFDPDAIVTFGAAPGAFPSLFGLPYDLRRRWIDVGTDLPEEEVGERAYGCAMGYILNRNEDAGYQQPLVSVFTPLNDTGDLLRRAYGSVASQTYPNWEWVLVDDSRTGGSTLALAREIASRDPRVKVYDVRDKSGGVVGEAKYRAAMLCRGAYLLELDHDDELTPWAIELLVQAFAQCPEAGFAYSDFAEVDERMQPLRYGDSFAFGYGSYYEESYRDARLQVARQPAVNPKTIRHIVGVPNHFRAWRREVYHALGGHNRRLSIADDYELLLRTFLETRMVHVPSLCYLQFLSRGRDSRNTQSAARADIQRRVRSIARHYEERIRGRFAELNLVDWAGQERPDDPLQAPSRFGVEEQVASLRMRLGPCTNVLVCGAQKSGTTALLYAVAAALGGHQRISYEPRAPERIELGPGAHVLCKLVLEVAPVENFAGVFDRFDKRIFIVRDPRDVLISRLLYMVRDQSFIFDPGRLQRLLAALERKEADADALDVVDLARLIGELENLPDYLEATVAHALQPMRVWQDLGEHFHLLRYEDFVRGKLETLNQHLGFSVSSSVQVPEWIQRVGRTKSHGDWKNWFTERDVASLRERFTRYLEFFGYEDDWQLPQARRVDPEHASRYVKWIVELKRSGKG